MRDENEDLRQCCGEGDGGTENPADCGSGGEDEREKKEQEEKEKEREERKKRRRRIIRAILIAIIIILLLLCFRSCSHKIWDGPLPDDTERVYEEDSRPDREDEAPEAEGRRLNIALAQNYRISDGEPYFYIGFPEENAYDVVFTLKGKDGGVLYRTDYVAPGTSVAVDGTAFLEKGEQKVDCLVSIYDRDSGALVSDCTTVVLNISYR